jgi:dipeptidyl aminopeptidase/acylaminoacyl peptidase
LHNRIINFEYIKRFEMKKLLLISLTAVLSFASYAQQPLTPEQLWQLGRVSVTAVAPNGLYTIYRVAHTDLQTEKTNASYFLLNNKSGKTEPFNALEGKHFVQWDANGIYVNDNNGVLWLSQDYGKTWLSIAAGLDDAETINVSPNGQYIAFSKHIEMHAVNGNKKYKDAKNSSAQIYTDLNYRHWDTWYDGKISHVFVAKIKDIKNAIDIIGNEPFDVPTKPFGGVEDYVWSPNSDALVYVCKKKFGKDYAVSTNTDVYYYDINSKTTTNLSEGMMGYDLSPQFNSTGSQIAWLSMARDGYEADKNDIIIYDFKTKIKRNLTQYWDETVDGGFKWSNDNSKIYFNATVKATQQVFEVATNYNRALHTVKQITCGDHDINGIYGQYGNQLIVTKTDMNRAAEIYAVDVKNGNILTRTFVNDAAYKNIAKSEVRMRTVKTTDGQEMGVWVIYPPNFDSLKKYPTLLYCQGGPQSAVSQFYSVRWNFQLIAANGYIVVAPNRRGLPGYGTKWNEDISQDWGGQSMRDYLAAIDDVAKEKYVDENRLGAVGASYGGYSVFMLAGIHENRFKSFIAHCGLFDMRSWYGTTEEMWFANWDLGGNYWDNPEHKSYHEFNPSNHISKWNTPILIFQGGKDYRVPTEQGLQAFKAAQMKGIKSKLVYFDDENHWILKPHNGLVWQREFFSWLKETL